MDESTEIRKLPPVDVFKLAQILDSGNAWKQVMAVIPEDPRNVNSKAKYSVEFIRLIESAGEKQSRSCTEILLDEWGTSGKVRPNVNTLLQVLVKAQLFRAAEYVSVEILKGKPPERPLEGPAAAVDLTLPPEQVELKQPLIEMGDLNIPHLQYSLLQAITNNFNETPIKKIQGIDGLCYHGHKLGTGAFGTVYYGEMANGRRVAVKKLADVDNLMLQFENEIKTLSKYQHENLVPLLGFSCDTPNYCLVYEFMSNGSLFDRLQIKNNDSNEILCGRESNYRNNGNGLIEKSLSWQKRIEIAIDAAEGINFLHTSKATPLIHRDIKSANILLDDNLVAKLGDFGLVKSKPNVSKSKLLTSTVFGTSAYMAPEAFRGDVSVKMDVFSFGVVLLELLTGLPPYDENRNGLDLVTYIEETVEDSIEFLLDKSAGDWDVPLAQELFNVSQECLEEKRKRPVILNVLHKLKSLRDNVSVV